jgi:hypothetical protein
MFKLVVIDGLYNVEYNGVIIDTFYRLSDAEDFIVISKYEMDHAYDNFGSEFDNQVEVLHSL